MIYLPKEVLPCLWLFFPEEWQSFGTFSEADYLVFCLRRKITCSFSLPCLLFLWRFCWILWAVTPVYRWLGREGISSLSDWFPEPWLLPFRRPCCAKLQSTPAWWRTSWAARSASPSTRASAATRASWPTVSPPSSEYQGWGRHRGTAEAQGHCPPSAQAGGDTLLERKRC